MKILSKERINKFTALAKRMYILIITILAPFIAQFLAFTLGDKKEISTEAWFNGWMSYIAIIASISLVYWQIDTNNKIRREDEQKRYNEKKQEKIMKDKEFQEKKIEGEKNIYSYITYSFLKNVEKYQWKEDNLNYNIVLNNLLSETKLNEKKDYENLLYEVNYNYLEKKIDDIIQMDKGINIIEINDTIVRINIISKKMKDNLHLRDRLRDLDLLKSQIRETENKHDLDFLQMIIYLLELLSIHPHEKELGKIDLRKIIATIEEFINIKVLGVYEFEKEIFDFFILLKEHILNYGELHKKSVPYIKTLAITYNIIQKYQTGVIHATYNASDIKELLKSIELELQLINELIEKIPRLLDSLKAFNIYQCKQQDS